MQRMVVGILLHERSGMAHGQGFNVRHLPDQGPGFVGGHNRAHGTGLVGGDIDCYISANWAKGIIDAVSLHAGEIRDADIRDFAYTLPAVNHELSGLKHSFPSCFTIKNAAAAGAAAG